MEMQTHRIMADLVDMMDQWKISGDRSSIVAES